jgi:hypothetical protein
MNQRTVEYRCGMADWPVGIWGSLSIGLLLLLWLVIRLLHK